MLPRNDINSNTSLARQLEVSTLDLDLWSVRKKLERRAQAKAARKARVSMLITVVSQLLLSLRSGLGWALSNTPAQSSGK